MAPVVCANCKRPRSLKAHCGSSTCTWRRCTNCDLIVDPRTGRQMLGPDARECETPEET